MGGSREESDDWLGDHRGSHWLVTLIGVRKSSLSHQVWGICFDFMSGQHTGTAPLGKGQQQRVQGGHTRHPKAWGGVVDYLSSAE